MKKGLACRIFVYFLCVSLLLLTGGFPRLIVEAEALSRPIGEMVSRGDVTYEAGGHTWRKAENTHLPLFQGVKIKTATGTSIILLANNSQVEVSQNSLISIDETDRLQLSQGSIQFRIPATTDTAIKVGSLSILRARSLQASKKPSLPSEKEEGLVGSISLHANGAVTVKSEKGTLSVLNQDRNVLASLSARESLTIPSSVASGKETVMVAQAGETTAATGKALGAGTGASFLGLSAWAWLGVGATATAIGGMGASASSMTSTSSSAPVCP